MTVPVLHIDFETRGVLDLREVGLHRYARDKDTDVWCMAWAKGDDNPNLWVPGDDEGTNFGSFSVHHYVLNGGTVIAHNAPFELEIWNQIMVPRYGWPLLKLEQTHCTMAQAYAMNLPGALDDAALALGLDMRKDTEGRALMLRMARPRSKPGEPLVWWDEEEKRLRLYDYCKQDVRVERELHKRLMPLSHYERRVWMMDYTINQRGVAADIPSATAAIALIEKVKTAADIEIDDITDGAVQKHTALLAMKEWANSRGVPVETLTKLDVVDLLDSDLPNDVRRVLTIRQEVGKASTAKLEALLSIAGTDGRLHNLFQYHAAGTGRFAGRKFQPHNLIRDVPEAAQVEEMLQLVREQQPRMIALMYGPPLSVISRCLRAFLIAPDGRKLIAGDFASVEGRGTAWISGEEWKLQAFRASDAGTGPGIYELAYAKMFNVAVESVKNPSSERQVGKVAELAFGYGGGVGAFRTMGSVMGVDVSDDQAEEFKLAWRAAHPCIKRTWYALDDAAKAAVRCPGEVFTAGAAGRQVAFKVVGSFLWCRLPSGRCLCYPYPKLLEGMYGPQLTYMTVPSADDRKKGRLVDDFANGPKWARISTYGGSLMENVVQALCRDLMVDAMLRLHDAGAQIVLHVHDEIVIEVSVSRTKVARDAMEGIMRKPPTWAADFPLVATPAVMKRYGGK